MIYSVEVNVAGADEDNVLALCLWINSALVLSLKIVECGFANIELRFVSLVRHSLQYVRWY
jgi:hypothetical protein